MTVSEWADRYRELPAEAAAEHGKWRTSRVPYLRQPMDDYNDPDVQMVVLQFCAQSAKTEGLMNCMMSAIHHKPGPMMVIQPDLGMAKAFMKDRFETSVRDTRVIRDRLDRRSKRRKAEKNYGDDRDTVFHKRFKGGQITVIGANSPAQLASRPLRDLFCDEIDRWPLSVGKTGKIEGDPLMLAQRRQTTFWNRKTYVTSTPTVKGISRIEGLFETGDQNRLWVPCVKCGVSQQLVFANLKWPEGQPERAKYECAHCGKLLDDRDKLEMISAGEWIPDNPEAGKRIRSYHLNALYSPWVSFAEFATGFVLAKRGGPEMLRTFVNTMLAETYDSSDQDERLDEHALKAREEAYAALVPKEVIYLTAAVDVQKDRLELMLMGHGASHQKWIIGIPDPDGGPVLMTPTKIWGAPQDAETWKKLDRWLFQSYPHGLGRKMRISLALVDCADGNVSDYVLRYTKARQQYRVFSARGSSTPGHILVNKAPTESSHRALVYTFGSDTAKDMIADCLRLVEEPGPGYIHLPTGLSGEFYLQLTAEAAVTKMRAGVKYRKWIKVRERNEVLDLTVMNLAAGALVDVEDPNAALESMNRGSGIPADRKKMRVAHQGVGA